MKKAIFIMVWKISQFSKPMICVSKRRRPILSPPGLGIYMLLKRDSMGPASITEPRSLPLFMIGFTVQVFHIHIICFKMRYRGWYGSFYVHFCQQVDQRVYITISGIFLMVTSSAVSSTAGWCAGFILCTCGMMVPANFFSAIFKWLHIIYITGSLN